MCLRIFITICQILKIFFSLEIFFSSLAAILVARLKNGVPVVRFSSIFGMLFSTCNSNENRWKTFCINFFKVKSYFDSPTGTPWNKFYGRRGALENLEPVTPQAGSCKRIFRKKNMYNFFWLEKGRYFWNYYVLKFCGDNATENAPKRSLIEE